jgi:hypothetical protein
MAYDIAAFMVAEPKRKPKPDDPAQYERFLEAARKAGADETKEGADRAFKKVAKPTGHPAVRAPRTNGRNPK